MGGCSYKTEVQRISWAVERTLSRNNRLPVLVLLSVALPLQCSRPGCACAGTDSASCAARASVLLVVVVVVVVVVQLPLCHHVLRAPYLTVPSQNLTCALGAT